MGQYDAVVISEAPNDEAYSKTILAIGATGAVRTETLRAFHRGGVPQDYCCYALSICLACHLKKQWAPPSNLPHPKNLVAFDF